MRMLPRSAAGGALIVVLVLSVAPPARSESMSEDPLAAAAVLAVPAEDSSVAPQEAVPEQVETDGGATQAPDESQSQGGAEGDVPVTPGAPEAPGVPEVPETPEEPVLPGDDVPDGQTATDAGAEAVQEDGDAEHPGTRSPEEPDDPLIPEIPASVPVEGTLVVIAEESPMPSTTAVEIGGTGGQGEGPGIEPEMAVSEPEQILLATDDGPLMALDPAVVGPAETGQRFVGEVALDDETRAAITETLVAEAEAEAEADAGPAAEADPARTSAPTPLTQEDPAAPEPPNLEPAEPIEVGELLDLAVTDAQANGERLAVGGLIIPGTGVGTAAGPKAHSADVMFYTGGGAPSDAQLTQLVRDAGSYWVSQTGGTFSSLAVSAVKRSTKYASNRNMRCTSKNSDALWSDAAKQFGRTSDSYLGSGRHLIVLVDDACGALSGGAAGRGSYGVMHSGGLVWVDLGARHGSGLPLSAATGMVAHEVGHNLGLGHGKSRVCAGSATDSVVRAGVPVAPCRDIEYGDPFNVMGVGAWLGDRRPPALSIAQQHALGIAAGGAVRSVRPSGGVAQTFTLQPAGGSTGLRGLNVQGSDGAQFYVEFRAMSGLDAGLGLRAGSVYETGQARGEFFTASGVRVVKSDAGRNVNGTHRFSSTVVSVRDSQLGASGLYQTGRTGKRFTPTPSTVRIAVIDAGAKSARVRIEFMPFSDVSYTHKFADEIAWMGTSSLSTGIAAGNGQREYRPKDRVTREAMAAFLYRMEAPRNFRAPAVSPFADVPRSHKFYREISWMYQQGLSTGTQQRSGKPKYFPRAHVSREAMAAFLYRLEAPRSKVPTASPFADVRPGQKFYREIAWMSQAGLSTGSKQSSGKPRYQPKQGVSREAMAAFLQRLNS